MDNADERLKFLMALFKAAATVGRKFSGQGLSFPDFAALYHIGQEPSGRITALDLAEKLGLKDADVSRLLTSLTKVRAIKKETNSITITDTGRKLLDGALKLVAIRSAGLIPEDQQKNLSSINAFLDNIKQ